MTVCLGPLDHVRNWSWNIRDSDRTGSDIVLPSQCPQVTHSDGCSLDGSHGVMWKSAPRVSSNHQKGALTDTLAVH